MVYVSKYRRIVIQINKKKLHLYYYLPTVNSNKFVGSSLTAGYVDTKTADIYLTHLVGNTNGKKF